MTIMGGVVIVCAFDPVDELAGQAGVLVVDAELGGRLVAEHRVELATEHPTDSLRFVPGSAAYVKARDALRARRASATEGQPRRARKTPAVES
ncbi:MAG TPA: hypothetical protein VN680_12760 [Burkholderiaceae bacterium]|nr:hypothetical protein [Burkholderiaceae bacterium]